jgi:hypothetical protein
VSDEPARPDEVTELLAAWTRGDRGALDRLLPLVEGELRLLAHRYPRRERPDHTLQTTALVNQAYLRLVDQTRAQWQNRARRAPAGAGARAASTSAPPRARARRRTPRPRR